MSLKKLPKAIVRTNEDMRVIAAGARAAEQRTSPARSRQAAKAPPYEETAAPRQPVSKPAPTPRARPATAETKPAPVPAPPQRVAAEPEPTSAPEMSLPPITGELLPPESQAESKTSGLRPAARKIVERHAVYAAVGGLIPLPVATVAGVTAVVVRMVKVLSDLYGVPFERDRTRSIVIGLMGGAVPTGLGVAAASTLALIAPGGGLVVGLAVSSMSAAACTRGIGMIVVEHFENGATSLDVAVIQA